MILRLLRYCVPWRVGLWMLVVVLAPMAAVSLMGGRGTPLVASGAALLPILLMVGKPTQRATLFETGLPISGRHLFIVRTIYRLALIWALGILSLTLAAGRADSALASDVLGVVALATLAILLPQSIRASQMTASAALLATVWIVLAVAGAMAWHFLPTSVALMLFGATIVIVALSAWFAIPASFQVAPRELAGPVSRPPVVLPLFRLDGARVTPWWPILRSALSWQLLYSLYIGATGGYVGFTMFSLFMGYGVFVFSLVNRRMRWTLGLPVSHRKRLLIVLLVNGAPLLGGWVVGTALQADWRTGAASVGSGPTRRPYDPHNDSKTNVPLEYWRVASGGVVPVIRAPWGETAQSPTLALFGLTFYNPYETGRENTRQFLEWQWARATQAVNGAAVPFSEHATYPGARRPLTQRPRMLILDAAAVVASELYLMFLAVLALWYQLRRPSTRVVSTIVYALCAAPAVVLGAGEMFYALQMRYGWEVAPLILKLLLQASQALPQNLGALVLVAAAPVAAMYWLLERQFTRAEFTGAAQPGAAA